jgi:CBS domain-containing protein
VGYCFISLVANANMEELQMNITPGIERMVAMIDEDESVRDTARLMSDKYIGSVVVTCHGEVAGLFTERELMMNVVGKGRDPGKVKVVDVMRTDHVMVSPETSVSECLDLMKENRCRHLLVFEGDEFIGIVSLRTMVTLMIQEKESLIDQLQHYITG